MTRLTTDHCGTVSRRRHFLWQALECVAITLVPARGEAQFSVTGRWRGFYPLECVGTHVAVMKGPADTTRALIFGNSQKMGVLSFVPSDSLTVPDALTFKGVARPVHDLFCSGHASANGRPVVVGGQYRTEVGTETAYEFNPLYTSPTHTDPGIGTPVWRQLSSTAQGRWYATVTGLPTGKLLATSGTKYGYVFTFGGSTGTLQNELRPLAMWKTLDWTAPTVTGPLPQARKDHTAIYDDGPGSYYTKRMVVFGGETGSGQKTDSVSAQALNGDDVSSRWIPLTVVQDLSAGLPDPRSRHSAIYYPTDTCMIVYGGSGASGNALGDVWRLTLPRSSNTFTWTRLLSSSVPGPGSRYGHTAIFDAGAGGLAPRMLVFGGRRTPTTLAPDTVWSLNLSGAPNWAPIAVSGGPGAREGHGAVSDPYREPGVDKFRMVIFGGHDGTDPLNETWSLWRPASSNAWTWSQVTGDTVPPARARHGTTRDWFWDRMVVLGGEGTSGQLLDDLWALDLGDVSGATLRWSRLTVKDPPTYAAPAPRAGHTAIAHSLAIVERVPEIFDPGAGALGSWQPLPSAERFLDPYPFMFVLPSGNVFHAGHRMDTRVLRTSSWSWDTTITATYELAGSAVMYRPGSILRCGSLGSNSIPQAVSNTDTIRFSGAADSHTGWTAAGQLLLPRKYHNLTALPSGDVLVTGGLRTNDSTDNVKRPQIWRRATGTWSTNLGLEPVIRNYHSAAILLPDARVLSTGGETFQGEKANPYQESATIFEPPYLFNGNAYATRPVITNVPCRIAYGQEFFISTPNVANMVGAPGGTVCLIRPGAVTHSFNQDQRYVPLNMYECSSDDRLRVMAPADSGTAPPGDYLLFIVNNAGVPSIAKWVRMGSVAPDSCDVDVPNRVNAPDPQVEIASDTEVWFYWTAPWDNPGTQSGTVAEYDIRAGGSSMDEAAFCAGWRGSALQPLSGGGLSQFGWVSGLLPCTQYRIALKARDGTENWSPISNEAVVTTMCGGGGGGLNAQPSAPLVRTAQPRGEGTGRSRVGAGLLGVAPHDGSDPLGLVPSAAAAWAVEMRLDNDAPVWSIYALATEEAQSLWGSDSAGIVVQGAMEQGRRSTRARLFPGTNSTRFGLHRLHQPGRLVFRGQSEFRQAWRTVATGTAGETYEVVSARHSRLGDQKTTMDLAGTTTVTLVPGDTLSLAYRKSPGDGAQDWFILVGGPGSEVPVSGNRRALSETRSVPTEFALHTNQPNPFSRLTTLRLALPKSEHVRLEVFDILGRRVRTLADGPLEAGTHAIQWDGRDAYGGMVSAGVYVTRVHAGTFRAQQTMVHLP